MFIVKWNNSNHKFLIKRNGEKFLRMLQKRGHNVVYCHRFLDGTVHAMVN